MNRAWALALLVLLTAGTAHAGTIILPTTLQPLSASPPLVGGARFVETEGGILHRVLAVDRVVVSVDASGAPFGVVATQRLTVLDRGDYSFVIPAPLVDVEAAPGTESIPGLRRDAILWNGFNADRRVLAARATLRAGEVASSLPLRIAVRGSSVVLENVTAVPAGAQVASVDPRTIGRYLDGVRAQVQSGKPVIGSGQLLGGAVTTERISVEAPLRVEGTVGGRRIALTLGDGHPLRATLPLSGPPRLRLTVTPAPPRALLRPPGAATWTAAANARGGAFVLRRTLEVLYRLARVRQYNAFLGDPDARSPSRTTYLYVTAARAVTPPVAAADGGGSSPWRAVILAATALAVFAAGAFAWSRT